MMKLYQNYTLIVGIVSILLSGLVIGEEILSPSRGRGVRRQQKILSSSGLPVTAAGSGRSLSSASGWRVSFNNLAHRKSSTTTANDSTDGWTAVVKNNQSISSVLTSTPLTIPSPASESFFNFPKKILVPNYVAGSIKRKSQSSITITPDTSTISSITRTFENPISSSTEIQHVTVGTKINKNYVQIERGKKDDDLPKTKTKTTREASNTKNQPENLLEENNLVTNSYRFSGNPLEVESGRGIMRRNGQLEQFPQQSHQYHQGQGQQQYIPTPSQHDGYVDPYHPVLQHNLNQPPHNPLHTQHQPPQAYHHQQHPTKKHGYHYDTSLLPLDKTLVYFSMIVTWIFWIVAFTTYYNLYGPHGKIRNGGGPIPSITISEDGHGKQDSTNHHSSQGQSHIIHSRSLDTSMPSGWNVNWGQVLYMISLAQETYDKFDFRNIDCQKKALCELTQKQEDFGDTGRKISNTFSMMDAVEGLPMPTIIQNYLKEYREAVNQGKNSSQPCSEVYSKCGFSIKEIVAKYQKKAATGKF